MNNSDKPYPAQASPEVSHNSSTRAPEGGGDSDNCLAMCLRGLVTCCRYPLAVILHCIYDRK